MIYISTRARSSFQASLLIFSAMLLSGCNKVEVDCGGSATVEAFEAMLQKNLEKSVRDQLDSEGSIDGYDSSKLRNGTKQITVKLEDVRTTRTDPDSTRKFCSARVKISLPSNVVVAADSSRKLAELSDVRKLAHQHRLERDGDKYGIELEYSIQPTDDGEKIVAETDDESSLFTFLTELFSSYLLSEEIRNQAIEAGKQAAAEEREAKLAEEEMNSAQQEQAAATLNEAKVQNKLAVQRINAIWRAIPKSGRDKMLDLQRAWIRKMTASCKVEAAGTSTFVEVREANRLNCETREQLDRARVLERFVSYEDDSSDMSEAPAPEEAR